MSMIGYLKMIDDKDLRHLDADPGSVEELIDQDCAKCELLDIDKAWAALHFAVAGDIYPDGDAVLAETFVGKHIVDFDLAYGPPAFLLSEDVEELSAKLDQLDVSEIESALRSERFGEADIYPFSQSEESIEEIVAYIVPYFEKLQAFYRLAQEKQKGVLIWIM